MLSLEATAQTDPRTWVNTDENQIFDEGISVMYTDISRAYDHAHTKEEKYAELSSEIWKGSVPEYGRLRVSLYGIYDATSSWKDAYARVLISCGFISGVASLCAFRNPQRRLRVVVHGDDFLAAGPELSLYWHRSIIDENLEGKHPLMGASPDMRKSIVLLNRMITWTDEAIYYEADRNHQRKNR